MCKYRTILLFVIAFLFMTAVMMPWNIHESIKVISVHFLFVFVLSFFVCKRGAFSLLIQYGKIILVSVLLGYINMYNHSWHTFGLVVLISVMSALICYGGYVLWQYFMLRKDRKKEML